MLDMGAEEHFAEEDSVSHYTVKNSCCRKGVLSACVLCACHYDGKNNVFVDYNYDLIRVESLFNFVHLNISGEC